MSPSPAEAAAPHGAADTDAAAQAKPARRSLLLRAGAVVLLLVAALGAGAWLLGPRLPGWANPFGGAKAAPAAEPPVKVTVPLGALEVNVGPLEARRYLKIGVELGVPSAKEAKEVEDKKPQIADLLITVLATMPVEVLGGESGRRALKKELLTRIKEELGRDHVGRVYVTEFVIQ